MRLLHDDNDPSASPSSARHERAEAIFRDLVISLDSMVRADLQRESIRPL